MSSFRSAVLFFAIAACSFFNQAIAQYSVDLPYKQINVEEKDGKAIFDGTGFIYEPGHPKLPSYSVSILIPPKIDFKDVTVKLNKPVYEDLAGEFEVEPPEDFNLPNNAQIIDGKDTTVYRSDKFYPSDFKGSVHFDKLWQYKVVRVTVYPYLYNPVKNKLRKLTGGSIDVSYKSKRLTVAPKEASYEVRTVKTENELRNVVANPQNFDMYGSAIVDITSMAKKYVIITTNSIYKDIACKQKIDDYEAHLRNDDGFSEVHIVTEGTTQNSSTWVNASTAEDRACNISEWIKNYCATPGDDWYVLLIGNPCPNSGDVPMVKANWNGGGFNPSPSEPWGTDYFYGDLKTFNLDDSAEATFQEIPVGRIPVYGNSSSDISRLNEFLQKTIDYKNATDVEWRRFALIPIVPLFWINSDDFNYGEIIKSKLTPLGWEGRRLYEPYGFNEHIKAIHPDVANAEPLPEVPLCNANIVVKNWNIYTPGLVAWSTHGNPKNAVSILTSDAASGLSNKYPAIVFSTSCQVAHAQTPGNLGTEVIYNNAIAFVGGTENLFRDQSEYNISIFLDDIKSNKCVGEAVRTIHNSEKNFRANKRVVLYGCPEVKINLPDTLTVPGPDSLSATWVSNSQIDLRWNAVLGAQQYVIERACQNTSRKRPEGWSSIASNVSGTSYSDNSVTPDSVFLYRVWAKTNVSRSGYSPVDSVSTFSRSLLPQPPTNLNVISDCHTAIISWDSPSTVQPGTSYNIKRRYINPTSTERCEFGIVENTLDAADVFDVPAEISIISGSAFISSTNKEFRDFGYVDGFVNSSTASVEFEVEVLATGKYTLRLRYSAGNGESNNIGLYVNDVKIKNITCEKTSNWNKWKYQFENVTLDSGVNHIKYKAETASNSCINIDHLYVKAINSYIDNNLINGSSYEYTVSTVNNYGESSDCAPTGIANPTLRPPRVGPIFDSTKNVTCNSFEYYWRNPVEPARLYNEVEFKYYQNLPGGHVEIVSLKQLKRNGSMYALDGLDNDQTVSFRFRSCSKDSSDSVSSWSSSYFVRTTSGTSPKIPSIIFTEITPDSIQIDFKSGYQISGHQIFRKEINDSIFNLEKEVDSTVKSIGFSISKDKIDSFAVRAFNSSDCGKSFSKFSPIYFNSDNYWPINPPSKLMPACNSVAQILLTWVDESAGETGFRIERSDNLGNWQFVANVPPNQTSYLDTTVIVETDYEYRVRATCADSLWPGYSKWTLKEISTKKSKNVRNINSLSFTSPSSTQMEIKWSLDNGNNSIVAGYTLQQSSMHGTTKPDSGTYSTIAILPISVKKFNVDSLIPGVNYWFRVNVITCAGEGVYKEQTEPVKTAPQVPPTNLIAVSDPDSQIKLSWLNNSFDADRFEVAYTIDTSNWKTKPSLAFDTVFYFNNLKPNTKYWFKVRACNAYGGSEYSEVISATTPTNSCYRVLSNVNGLNGFAIGLITSEIDGFGYCKATDGDINTFYQCSNANGAYTGLDFATGLQYRRSRIIERIRFFPRRGYASRMVGGKFQVSNSDDFSDAEDLYTILSLPTEGWNDVTVSCTKDYGYIRYLSPDGSYGNIAEMEFYEKPIQYTIEASAINGSISPDGNVEVNSHGSQTFIIAVDSLKPYYKLDDVLVNNESMGPINTYTFSNVYDRNYSIKAIFSLPNKYEAEDAELSLGAGVNINHSGYSDRGFVDGFWRNGNNPQVSFTIYIDTAAYYAINLRYSAGNGTSNCMGLYVDGIKIKNLTCPGTGNWDSWSEIFESCYLNEGIHIINYKAEEHSDLPINIDYIDIKSPCTITAIVDKNNSNGTISPKGNIVVPYGGSQEFTIVPSSYYEVGAVKVNGTDMGALTSYTFNGVTQNCEIAASFIPVERYEAENAVLTGTANVNTNHTGFSGTGFVDGYGGSSTAGVLFYVFADSLGDYEIKLYYSAGNGTSNNVGLYIDGVKVKNLECPGTANWDTWAFASENIQLTDGVHQIEYKAESSIGNPINLDYMSLNYLGQLDYEAEDATITGTAHINNNYSGYSGKGFVDGYFQSTTAETNFPLNLQVTGMYEVRLRYSAGNGTSTSTGLYLNGNKIKDITCPETENWNSWSEIADTILISPNDKISYKTERLSDSCINIDKIILNPVFDIAQAINLKVYILDQTLGSNQQTQPRFYIQNESDSSLSNFTMKYYFTVEDGQTPVVENYYMAPYCNAVVMPVSGNNYCVQVTFNNTLPAGGRIPENDGLNFGLHYQNYPHLWNQGNDFSQPTTNNYTITNKVAVFNSSNRLVYGSEP